MSLEPSDGFWPNFIYYNVGSRATEILKSKSVCSSYDVVMFLFCGFSNKTWFGFYCLILLYVSSDLTTPNPLCEYFTKHLMNTKLRLLFHLIGR